ncbi:alpha/beta hydrolase [Bacillus sp. HMF5848]|uniref:alpha/beta hydrolase n=1 Tax=Bacillus sp. HMF5848 TaxID=2495421 RepID=UPI000F775A86|nr:alpha/beta hydrolase [Bacillus sp. HMF5848]RSK28248.1 alpha/beta hydrolase [Bacillus sp. HMF5848]
MWKWKASQPKGVVVIVHGAAEHHGRYKWLIEMWRSSGYHVIMGDLPGQGLSRRSKRGHIDSFDEYILEVSNWVKEATSFNLPIFLIGHSMGGLISIRYLQERKNSIDIAGVILSSPCLGLVQYPPTWLEIVAKGLNIVEPDFLIDSHLTIDLATRNQEVKELDVNDTLYVTKMSVRWYEELRQAIKQAFSKGLEVEHIPIMLMQGGDDKIVDKEACKKWINQLNVMEKTYKEWPQLYHEIFNEPEREAVFQYAYSFFELIVKSRHVVKED